MCVCLISVMSSAEFVCSVRHQVLTPWVWPCEGGSRPQSWHPSFSAVLAFLLFIRKREIRQGEADWKKGSAVSTSTFVFTSPSLSAQERIITAMILLMMPSLGCWVVVYCYERLRPAVTTRSLPEFKKLLTLMLSHVETRTYVLLCNFSDG